MARVLVLFICLVYLQGGAFGVKNTLPHYLVPCHKSDPNINKCGLEKSKTALVEILKGDKDFNLPVLSPLHLPSVSLVPSGQLSMNFTDLIITGLETAVVKDVQLNLAKQNMIFVVETSYLNLLAHYKMSGRILVFPVIGEGPANITFARSVFTYNMTYEFVNKKSKKHIKIKDRELTYQTDRTYYQFDNLFNGDARLGPEINKFMNENWKELQQDIGPTFSETVSTIITSIGTSYFSAIPYDVLLPD